jgi:hypothetical protein
VPHQLLMTNVRSRRSPAGRANQRAASQRAHLRCGDPSELLDLGRRTRWQSRLSPVSAPLLLLRATPLALQHLDGVSGEGAHIWIVCYGSDLQGLPAGPGYPCRSRRRKHPRGLVRIIQAAADISGRLVGSLPVEASDVTRLVTWRSARQGAAAVSLQRVTEQEIHLVDYLCRLRTQLRHHESPFATALVLPLWIRRPRFWAGYPREPPGAGRWRPVLPRRECPRRRAASQRAHLRCGDSREMPHNSLSIWPGRTIPGLCAPVPV